MKRTDQAGSGLAVIPLTVAGAAPDSLL